MVGLFGFLVSLVICCACHFIYGVAFKEISPLVYYTASSANFVGVHRCV